MYKLIKNVYTSNTIWVNMSTKQLSVERGRTRKCVHVTMGWVSRWARETRNLVFMHFGGEKCKITTMKMKKIG
jgi:hypothetical protein